MNRTLLLSAKETKEANELLVAAVCEGLLSFSLVDNRYFSLFAEKISRGSYSSPLRTKLTELVDQQYGKC